MKLITDDRPAIWTDSLPRLVQSVAAGSLPPFRTIYADPPWRYRNDAAKGAAANHYLTMALDEIAALPVEKLVADQALLWLWVTNAFLFASFDIIHAWGFEFKATLIWDKIKRGTGNYVRNQHEYLMIASRGGQMTRTND